MQRSFSFKCLTWAGVLILALGSIETAVRAIGGGNNGPIILNVPNLPGVPIGYLLVSCTPACAASNRPIWHIQNYTNRLASGDLVAAIAYTYTLGFDPLPGYAAPALTNVTLTAGQTNIVNAAYTALGPGYLKVSLVPQGAPDAGARWFLAGE
jgi:hypothetical protein